MSLDKLIAWGQYMHWAELQFQQFKARDPTTDVAAAIGTVAHWLASEYVVLEGWRELNVPSGRISALIQSYPEHQDLLRRCRNAVFHFQKQALDPRLSTVLADEREELRWSIALHFEFQGQMIHIVAALAKRSPDPDDVVATISRAIGWFPEHPLSAKVNELYAMAAEIAVRTAGDESTAALDLKAYSETILKTIDDLDMYPASSALTRIVRGQAGASGA